MGSWLNLGQVLTANSVKFSKNIAIKDKTRELTYRELNARVNKLAHQFYGLGLKKGDKVAVFLENCIEIVEVFLATAKTGIIIVPINFRLVGVEIEYIVENSDAKALIVHDEFAEKVTSIKPNLTNISPSHFISVNMNPNAGGEIEGYQEYEKFIAAAPTSEPEATVRPEDTWILIYTSGTTGKPKGVIR
ncbi:MAG: AMP-binding protein, partial [Deltaproteobacteria bacterium]|nr:AMP-binding protein [Deltaproteobacteria bacterium]